MIHLKENKLTTAFKILPVLQTKIIELNKIKPIKISVTAIPNCRGAVMQNDNCINIIISAEYNKSVEMINWTLAHELSHIELNHAPNIFCYEDMLFTLPEEIEANNHAAAILLPEDLLKLHFEAVHKINYTEKKRLFHLSENFGVSYTVLKYRLETLNLMKRSEFDSYF